MINDALESLVQAVETERSDVIQSVVKMVQRCEENDEGIGLTLNNLFRSECCEQGTILHLAVHVKSKDSVRTLLTLGAFPSCKNEAGLSALETSTSPEITAIFNELLLHNIAQGSLARVEEFLDAGCDVNCVDSERTRNTPLHWASSYGTPEIVQVLIDDGGYVNAQNADGVTPLHDAVQRKDPNIVGLLLANNADMTLAAHGGKLTGKSSLDIAEPEILALLNDDSVRPKLSDLASNQALSASSTTLNSSQAQAEVKLAPPRNTDRLVDLAEKMKLQEPATTQSQPASSDVGSSVSNEDDSNMSASLESHLELLWPPPQKISVHPSRGEFRTADKLVIAAVTGPEPSLVHEILNTWRAKRQSFLDLNIEFVMETIAYQTTPAIITFDLPSIVCQVDKNIFHQASSYKLTILQNQVRAVASDLAGLHYAVSTFIQLLEIFEKEEAIPSLQIHDWPDLKCRGVMLDCSKGRILYEANLWELVDRLSILKINEVHLYSRIDHPKVDSSNPDIWQFPYTRSMLIEFDRFCQQRFVTLVPVLDISQHVDYDQLSGLFPLFLDYLSCFTCSRKINIGPRLSMMLLNIGENGMLSTKNFLPLSDCHHLLLCGEALKQTGNTQQSLKWLPSNMMLMSYGYTADFDFTPTIKQYTEYGSAYYVCPGTSSWNSIAGCPRSAVANIHGAMKQGIDNQALGMLLCDWSGKGHVTDSLFSLPSFVSMAGMSWNKGVNQVTVLDRLPALLSLHMLSDAKCQVGKVLVELGKLEYDLMAVSSHLPAGNCCSLDPERGSLLFQLLVNPDSVDLTHLTPAIFQKSLRAIRHLHGLVQSQQLLCFMGEELTKALKLNLDLALTTCRIGLALCTAGRNPGGDEGVPSVNIGLSNLPITVKTDLANRLLALREGYRTSWFSRCLPKGYAESHALVFGVINSLLPGSHHHHLH
ncbi:uncharacterized protein [Watersipora subatra]|uniref:uncharacterized protein n=1 Tax=Watersipora subatra TaxID=2589382 RepID=UPI00355B3303